MQLIRKIFTLPIWLYQIMLSPYLMPACRFQPTCSAYAKEAIMKWGIFKGSWLAAKRLLCCHPYGKSGYDPVP
jgi:putative membrane protein insertion efficiency factor